MSGPLEWGWQPSIRAIDVENYLEARMAAAIRLLDEASALLEAGQPIPAEMVQRARELIEK